MQFDLLVQGYLMLDETIRKKHNITTNTVLIPRQVPPFKSIEYSHTGTWNSKKKYCVTLVIVNALEENFCH